MRKGKAAVLASILLSATLQAGTGTDLAHTYSIVAYDSATGEFGAAVQSHYFKVADVIWAEPGVGVVATQSFVDFAYGPLGLAMMRLGKPADWALKGLLASDSTNQARQVAMIDRQGRVAVYTGEKCIEAAGHLSGKHYSCQANLMTKNTVCGAMAVAFEETRGSLAERMMAALEAAQREGGDIRGKQSAAMLVVSGTPTGQAWRDRIVDLRVDDSPEPLVELRRLLNLNKAYKMVDRGDELITEGKIDEAAKAYSEAAALTPGNVEISFWQAVTFVEQGQIEKALPIFKQVFAADPAWRDLVPRLVKSNLLKDDARLIERIISQ
ncbi:MAG: DUF1028 domain-containing protein [candidate division Zixibacteria bacterium]|nr:DUF1028 domain-containing protein [candidate division Zixibacteria bacterium]